MHRHLLQRLNEKKLYCSDLAILFRPFYWIIVREIISASGNVWNWYLTPNFSLEIADF